MANEHTKSGLGVSILDDLDNDEANAAKQHRDLLNAFFVLVKNTLIFNLNNPSLLAACERVATTCNDIRNTGDGGASIAFLPDGVYVNRTLLKLRGAGYQQGEYLFHVWKTLEVSEIETLNNTRKEDWLKLAGALQASLTKGGTQAPFNASQFSNIKLIAITEASHDDAVAITTRLRALRAYAIATISTDESIEKLASGRRVRLVEVKRPLQDLISVSRDCPELLLSLVHLKRHKETVANHLVNTAVLVVCMTRQFELTRVSRSELAMRAILHDIGRALVAPTEAEANDATGQAAESRYAMESVCKMARSPGTTERILGRLVVANETRFWAQRDREATSARYPFDICAGAKLIAVAHAYDLLTTPQRGRPALLADEALRVVMAGAGERFDATAVRLLVNELGIYPVGSLVALDDGRTAIVIEAPHDHNGPDRPRVKVIRDAGGNVFDGGIIDLAGDEGAKVRIESSVDAEEVDINTPAFLLG